VDDFLTGGFARRNPTAYASHFRRLDPAAQSAYLERLPGEDLADHARALGVRSTIGFTLRLDGPPVLESAVAGKRLRLAKGWTSVAAAEASARSLAATLGPPAVTGLLVADLESLLAEGPQLAAAGWPVEVLTLTEDLPPGTDAEWAVSGELVRGGRFWSSRQLLPRGAPEETLTVLRQAAASCGGQFVRVKR
jgi:hypothetical protein